MGCFPSKVDKDDEVSPSRRVIQKVSTKEQLKISH